jgi:hypothetical protein
MTEPSPTTSPNEPVDCSEETAYRAGARATSLKPGEENEAAPDIDKDDVSESDLDDAIEESMDASDPPAFTQP